MPARTIVRREPAELEQPAAERRHRNRPPLVVGVCWLVLAGAIPIQWFAISAGGAGVLRFFHLASALFVFSYLAWRGSVRPIVDVLLATPVFQIAILYWLVFLVLANTYNALSAAEVFQQAMYALVALIAAGFFASLQNIDPDEDPGCWKLLRWSALVAVCSLAFFFFRSAASKGLDPVGLLFQAVRSGDPGTLEFSLFRPVFAAGEKARASLRHEIFASLLLMMWISMHAHRVAPTRSTWARVAYRASVAVSVAAIAVSLSRSVILALLAGAAVSPLRSLVRGRLGVGKAVLLALIGGAVGAAAAWGFLDLLVTRFTVDNGSYAERVSAISSSIDTHPLFGGGGGPTSAHNFVLDSWRVAGILGAAAASTAAAALLFTWIRTLGRYLRSEGGGAGPTTAVVAIVMLPLVRLATAGGGVLHLTEWLALAFFGGYLVGARGSMSESSGQDAKYESKPLSGISA